MGYYADKYKDRFQVNAPQRRFSQGEADQARKDESFWSGIGGMMPGIGAVGGGILGGLASGGNPLGMTAGAGIGSALGQGVGGMIGAPSQERGRQVDQDELEQLAMQQALADFYRSGY